MPPMNSAVHARSQPGPSRRRAILAVSLAAHQVVNADNGIGAGFVFHNDALSDTVLEIFRNDTAGEINAAAGRIGNDDPHCSGRECLRRRRCGESRNGEEKDRPQFHVEEAPHAFLP